MVTFESQTHGKISFTLTMGMLEIWMPYCKIPVKDAMFSQAGFAVYHYVRILLKCLSFQPFCSLLPFTPPSPHHTFSHPANVCTDFKVIFKFCSNFLMLT